MHLICNNFDKIIELKITKSNKSDVSQVSDLAKNLQDFLLGGKKYLSKKIEEKLTNLSLNLITKCRKNTKEKKISPTNKILLHRRGIIETIFGKINDLGA